MNGISCRKLVQLSSIEGKTEDVSFPIHVVVLQSLFRSTGVLIRN